MNTILFRRASFLLSLAALSVVTSELSAQAQTPDFTAADVITTLPAHKSQAAVAPIKSNQAKTSIKQEVNAAKTPKNTVKTQPTLDTKPLTSASALLPEPSASPMPGTASKTTAPIVAQAGGTVLPGGTVPGTVPGSTVPGSTVPGGTVPGGTVPGGTVPGTVPGGTVPSTTPGVTPDTNGTVPDRVRRTGSSYIGIGGNIGISGGQTALGLGNFTIISKLGLARHLSVRPSAVIGDNSTVLIPLTYDFSFDSTNTHLPFGPYLGGGIVIGTGDNSDVGPLISAGVDVPISSKVTATAGVNVGFLNDDTSIGVSIGVGYNF